MGILKNFNRKAKVENESGLSTNSALSGGRFFGKKGQANVTVKGMHFLERLNIYHSLLTMSRYKFLLVILAFFISINLVFAGIYLWIGIDHLNGLTANTFSEKFGEAFFFSAQTFTTVGYGRVSPVGFLTSFVSSMEALSGLMSFAVVTGLIYGRFSRPKAYLLYSKNMLFSPFRNGVALMFRFVPYTKNYLVNVEVKVTVAMRILDDGILKTRFFNMPLDISKANTLTSNWTLVHVINEDSPLYNLSKQDIENAQAEFLVFVQGFDETFSNTVISRASYTYEDLIFGAKFSPMFHPNEDNTSTILHLDKLDDFTETILPEGFTEKLYSQNLIG
jgi:inward rectifier potassium channel